MLDLSRFWNGIDGGLDDKWSVESRPSLSLPPEDQQRLDVLALLRLLKRVLLGAHCGASHSEAQLLHHTP